MSFEQHLILLGEFNMPITSDDLRISVRNYLERSGRTVPIFNNNIPGRDWVYGFIRRHPNLSQRIAENVKLARAEVTVDTLEKYITHLEKSIKDIPQENIYNYDETNLTDSPGKKKILMKRGTKYPELIINHSKCSTSLMICGTATGYLFPMYVVYRAGRIWNTWCERGPPGMKYDVFQNV